MEISRVELTEEQAKDLLPPRVRGMLKKEGTSVFASMDGEHLAAIAVVTAEPIGFANYAISHIDIMDGYGLKEFKEITEYIEARCADTNSKMLSVRISGDVRKMVKTHHLLTQTGYTPLNLNGRLLMYYFQDLLDTDFVTSVMDSGPVGTAVLSYNELSKQQITGLTEKLKALSNHDNFKKPDVVFARFFVIDGVVKGYIEVKEVSPGILYLSDVYVEKSPETKLAFPMMVGSLTNIISSFMPEDAVLYLSLYSDSHYKGFKKLFGQAEVDDVIFDYGKIL